MTRKFKENVYKCIFIQLQNIFLILSDLNVVAFFSLCA